MSVEKDNPIGEIRENNSSSYANLIQLSYEFGDTPGLRATTGAYHHRIEQKTNEYHQNNKDYTIDKQLSDMNSVVAKRNSDNAIITAFRGTMFKPRDLVADTKIVANHNFDGGVFLDNHNKFSRVREKYPTNKHILTGHSLGAQSAKQLSQKYNTESHLFSMFDVGTGKTYDEEPSAERTYYIGIGNGILDPLSAYSSIYKGNHKYIKSKNWDLHTIGNFTKSKMYAGSGRELGANRPIHLPHNLNRTRTTGNGCIIRHGKKICF